MSGDQPSDIEDDDDDYATWSTERLKALEESLYDMEIDGHDTWFERDKILNELNSRS